MKMFFSALTLLCFALFCFALASALLSPRHSRSLACVYGAVICLAIRLVLAQAMIIPAFGLGTRAKIVFPSFILRRNSC